MIFFYIYDLISLMSSRTENVYHQIYEEIISGQLKPGQKIPIAELAEKYGVGLSPVREALSQLIATDLVIAVAQKGFTVAPISCEDLHDIYDTRSYVEQIALGLSIDKGSDEWEAEMLASFHKLYQFELKQTITSVEQYKEWEERHRAFNQALIRGCGLKYLLKIQAKLYQQTERYRRFWLLARAAQGNMLYNAMKQKKIMDAALKRDKDKALKLLQEYYQKAKKDISKKFEAHGNE